MINLERVGDVVKFTFQDNPLYLNDGTIEVPVNSLSLLIDESDIATFKKSNGDAFLSCSLDELGMSKEQLITWYKENAVDEGMSPEEVEEIVESATTNLFGYAEYDSANTRINFKHDASGSVISSIDATDFVIDGMIDNVEIVTVDNVKYLKITFNTESGKEPILIPLSDIFNPDNYYTKTATDALLADKADTATTYTKTEVDNALSGKADTSAVTEAIDAATSGKADTSAVTEVIDALDAAYKAADAAISGAVDSVSGDVATEAQRAISAETALDEKINTVSGNVVTSGEIESMIEEAVSGKVDTDVFDEKERAVSTALNDLNERKLDASAYTPTDLSNYYTKSETSGKTEIQNALNSKADTNSVYTKVEVDNAISAATSGKVDTDVFDEKERAISLALNDLNERKLDASAYTPTDLSNYYTKSETDDEIAEAISGKADTSAVTEVNNALTAHTANTDIHVTSTDKTNWNSKPNTVSLTQAEYDALTVKDPNTFYVITDAEGVDLDNYYTKTETDSALSGKQDTLVAGTNITISGNVISAEGGGKAIEAGRGISITTGETADTVSFSLPISADSKGIYTTSTYPFLSNSNKSGNVIFGNNNQLDTFGSRNYSENNLFFGSGNHITINGSGMLIGGTNNRNAYSPSGDLMGCVLLGNRNIVGSPSEFACGFHNVHNSESGNFGDSGNTLFSIGNGTFDIGHNAFEIRQNGDIYIVDTNDTSTTNYYEKPMIKLQDALGGGGSSYTAGDGIDITNDVISVTGKVDTSAITTSMTSGSTDSQVPSAKAVYDNFGGLKLVKLTQAEYDALVTKDSDTLYVVTDN